MFCKYCGKQIDDEGGSFCPYCGKHLLENCPPAGSPAQPPPYPAPRYNLQDLPNGGWTVLGFFFPLVGFILYLVWQTTFPIRSKLCGKGALIGVIADHCGSCSRRTVHNRYFRDNSGCLGILSVRSAVI